jgi:hypothetical protein
MNILAKISNDIFNLSYRNSTSQILTRRGVSSIFAMFGVSDDSWRQTPTIVCDQGSNVLLAAKLMRWYQINCAAHVFNLIIVTDGFK